ncbi:cytotoxic translational repressor of toxin-antitoxin stability system [Desulfovibrio sp. OttesenSCG-928-A18]|nr:cytotoxic translational repressor of toxin-antitoxin stability system [Desulfovibrio sp. OttesenSCG-928-A18]
MANEQETPWVVIFTGKSRKQKTKLPPAISSALDLLYGELEQEGPERTNWPHYGKITGKPDMHHCHLNKGRPTYVAVWKVTDRSMKLTEIRYVGTHENANYRRID